MCFGIVNGELTPYALTVLIMRLGSAITISAATARLANWSTLRGPVF